MLAKLKFKIEDVLFKDKNFVEFENLPRMEFSQPPAHIDADLSSTWALSAAKIIKKPFLSKTLKRLMSHSPYETRQEYCR